MISKLMLPKKSNKWRSVWHTDGLPKVNIFCWQLAQNKLLTGENLIKRGFLGPLDVNYADKHLNQPNISF